MIERQEVPVKGLSVGDWVEVNMGEAYQILDIETNAHGRVRLGFVKNKYHYIGEHATIDLLIAA